MWAGACVWRSAATPTCAALPEDPSVALYVATLHLCMLKPCTDAQQLLCRVRLQLQLCVNLVCVCSWPSTHLACTLSCHTQKSRHFQAVQQQHWMWRAADAGEVGPWVFCCCCFGGGGGRRGKEQWDWTWQECCAQSYFLCSLFVYCLVFGGFHQCNDYLLVHEPQHSISFTPKHNHMNSQPTSLFSYSAA